jgi:aryl-phospho-beta-D-glucosidase BglC (GH1 family)
MKYSRRSFLGGAIALPPVLCAAANSKFVRTRGADILTPDGNKLFLRGTNLGNWLEPEGYMFGFESGPVAPHEIEGFFEELIGPDQAEAFWRQYRRDYITKADIEFIEKCGFNSVRVPLHYKYFLTDAGFELLDPLIEWCRAANLWVILDMHCAPGGQTGTNIDDSRGYPWLFESAQQQQLLIDVWTRIARHYREEPVVLGYDLLNEPIPHFPRLSQYNSRLEPLYKRVTAAIRSVDANHTIILGGAQWDSNFNVFGAAFDNNLIYELHKYWVDPVRTSIEPYIQFREKYKVPLWCGESGENDDQWVKQFVQMLEATDIGWCFWPYKKMTKTSCLVSFKRPAKWDAVVALSKLPGGTDNAEKRIAARPSLVDSRNALEQLLENIQLKNCSVNRGYLEALGMHA